MLQGLRKTYADHAEILWERGGGVKRRLWDCEEEQRYEVFLPCVGTQVFTQPRHGWGMDWCLTALGFHEAARVQQCFLFGLLRDSTGVRDVSAPANMLTSSSMLMSSVCIFVRRGG